MRKYLLTAIFGIFMATAVAGSAEAHDWHHGHHGYRGWHGGYAYRYPHWHGGPVVVGVGGYMPVYPAAVYPVPYPVVPAPVYAAPAGISLGFAIR